MSNAEELASSSTATTSPPTVVSSSGFATSCSSKKGIVYDYFFQYCSAVTLTESAYWTNFDAGFDSSCADPSVIERHQPMIWGSDRIQSGYSTIMSLPAYAKPRYVMTFNEPNYAFGGGIPTNILSPQQAAALWPQITSLFYPQGIQLIAPSPIDCSGDPFCQNVETVTGWLDQFQAALSSEDWAAIHALNYHTYATDFSNIVAALTNLYARYGKTIWIGEIAAGGGSMNDNVNLMEQFVPWAESTDWIERYFWNQATRTLENDPNIQNSYLVDKASDGSGNGALTSLGVTYTEYSSGC